MSYDARKNSYEALGKNRGSRVLTYVTGDRSGLETQIGSDALGLFGELLDDYQNAEKISLFLYTRGGETLAAWSLVNLLREFCKELEIIVPAKCQSSGTLICLGADNIIMTKQATLGPIDPSVNSPLNPEIPGAAPQQRMPLSVEDIASFIEMAREQTGIKSEQHLVKIFTLLAENIHPIALGNATRARKQIQELARKLLSLHMNRDEEKERIDRIVAVLCSEAGSHDYTIHRTEAQHSLDMKIEAPNDELYSIIQPLYRNIRTLLKLNEPYNPAQISHTAATSTSAGQSDSYSFVRALVETDRSGGYEFVREGRVLSQNSNGNTFINDQVSFEAWRRF